MSAWFLDSELSTCFWSIFEDLNFTNLSNPRNLQNLISTSKNTNYSNITVTFGQLSNHFNFKAK